MGEFHDQDGIGSSGKSGYGPTAWLLVATLAATLAVFGWNMKWTSSGPTSVTIIGINGPDTSGRTLPDSDRDAAVLVATELVDSR
jgi:hypothetical protein